MSDLPRIHVVSAALLYERKDGDRLILQLREGGDYADLWETPGGKVEGKESYPEALLRELREELGLLPHYLNHWSKWENLFSDVVTLPKVKVHFHLYLVRVISHMTPEPFPRVAKALGLFTKEDCQRLLDAEALTPCTALAMPAILKRM